MAQAAYDIALNNLNNAKTQFNTSVQVLEGAVDAYYGLVKSAEGHVAGMVVDRFKNGRNGNQKYINLINGVTRDVEKEVRSKIPPFKKQTITETETVQVARPEKEYLTFMRADSPACAKYYVYPTFDDDGNLAELPQSGWEITKEIVGDDENIRFMEAFAGIKKPSPDDYHRRLHFFSRRMTSLYNDLIYKPPGGAYVSVFNQPEYINISDNLYNQIVAAKTTYETAKNAYVQAKAEKATRQRAFRVASDALRDEQDRQIAASGIQVPAGRTRSRGQARLQSIDGDGMAIEMLKDQIDMITDKLDTLETSLSGETAQQQDDHSAVVYWV